MKGSQLYGARSGVKSIPVSPRHPAAEAVCPALCDQNFTQIMKAFLKEWTAEDRFPEQG